MIRVIAVPLIALAVLLALLGYRRYSRHREQEELRIRYQETEHFTYVPHRQKEERK